MVGQGRALGLLAMTLVLAGPALAQQSAAPGAAGYEAAYFAASSPSSALDIARLVPGFALDLGNLDARGFAGAAGNVVINGARPSSKSEGLELTLSRIPATRVARVEIAPGSRFGADYAGKAQVLNVILSDASGVDGNVTVSARRFANGSVAPNLSASAIIQRGASTFNLSAATQRFDGFDEGPDVVTDVVSGDLIERRKKINRYHDRAPFISGSWALETSAGRSAHLNARYEAQKYILRQSNHVTPVNGAEHDDSVFSFYRNPAFELGGDVSRPLAGGVIKLVGVATRRRRITEDRSQSGIGTSGGNGFEQFLKARRNENIVRLGWTRANLAGVSIETGIEGVLNSLNAHNDLFQLASDKGRTPIDLPIEDATVKEARAEAYFRFGRQLSSTLRVDGGLAYELSDLSVRGDADADRTLKFLKPNLSLDWKSASGWHAQLLVRRTVAQLDFFDFLSRAELNNNVVNGGNSSLLPQRTWEYRATVDRPVLGDGIVRLELGHDRISLLQDRILTPEGFDSPGNIGSGRRSFAKLTVDAPLTWIGLKGARLKFNGELQRTRVDDPINGKPRNFSGEFPDWQYSVEYRHDIGRFSYGFYLDNADEVTTFRTDELNSFYIDEWFSTAFVEYRPSKRTTVTFDVRNMFDVIAKRTRLLFDPNRTDPLPSIKEERVRNGHASFQLTFKQSFGG